MSRRILPIALVAAALIAGCGSSNSKSQPAKSTGPASTPSTPSTTASASATATDGKVVVGFENVPIEQGAQVAPASTTSTTTVDGFIKCLGAEQLQYHIHAHLAVYVDGQPRQLPGGIGIPGSQVQNTSEGPVALGGQCIYYLHTHAPDGVIHIESPTARIYTLGQFFDEWRQPLTSGRIGAISGKASWIVNGKAWTKSPRDIPLTPHANIQVNIGQPPVPYRPINWSVTRL